MKFSPEEKPRLRPVDAFPVSLRGQEVILLRDPLGYAASPLMVAKEMAPVLIALDGNHSLRDLQVIAARALGRLVMLEEIENFLATLDKNLFLETKYFETTRQKLEDEFRRQKTRPATHAGQSYPAEGKELSQFLANILALWPVRSQYFPRAIIAPHIDLRVGARAFAAAYQGLSWPRGARIILIGTGHFLESAFSVAYKHFETPLGHVPYDEDFVSRLEKELNMDLRGHEWAHKHEHSLEFQAIFLKYLLGDFKIVPILVSGPQGESKNSLEKLAQALKRLVDEKTFLVTGVDFCHLGLRYGDRQPAGEPEKQKAKMFDHELLKKLLSLDAEGFYKTLAPKDNYYKVCGFGPLYVLARTLSGKNLTGTILYQDAVDFGQGSIVSFAAAAFFDR
ncbi:AmmeMemoRadiSam system protein B [Thermodesulfatator atlanticus]